jgi:hypothetical protein
VLAAVGGIAMNEPRLDRVAFRTSRLLDFTSQRELTAQIGHEPVAWPLVVVKELVDNALDAAEEGQIAPVISIAVSTERGEIVVSDNGPGIPASVVRNLLDHSYRVSSREAYVSPTRGAQGNALKTLIAMPFAFHGEVGTVGVEAQGTRHTITFRVDQLRQEPAIKLDSAASAREEGTRVTVFWPESACSILEAAEERFLQIADDFGWINPHLRIRVEWNGIERVNRIPSNVAWDKWRPCAPTSAYWYDLQRLERYIAAHVSQDQDQRRDRTVREFISEIRGFSGSAKQKRVLDDTGLTRASLSSLFAAGEPKVGEIESLLRALKANSNPVKPKDLGLIGKDHLLARFNEVGVEGETFKYQKVLGEDDGLPWLVETAFGWCPTIGGRRIIVGVNWSVGLGNPFRSFSRHGGEGLEALLGEQRAGRDEPIILVLHYVCPRVAYTDRGKSAIVLPGR